MTPLTFETTSGIYRYFPNPGNEDALIVTATYDLLDILLNSLEIAGVEEGRYFEDYEILPPATQHDHNDTEYRIELTRADFCLFMNFEVLNYV